MNKILKNKWVIAAVVVVAGYLFFFTGKADAQEIEAKTYFDVEIGQYEKRIDSGAYTSSEDSLYYKVGADLPVFKALGLRGDLEYVDSDSSELYASVGTTLSTPIGALGTGVLLSQSDGSEDLYELYAVYDLNVLDVFTTQVDVSIDEDEAGVIEASVAQLLTSIKTFDVYVGGGYGQSFGYSDDYTYTLGFVRVQHDVLYAQYNYLNNDLSGSAGTNDEWAGTVDFGLAFSF
tara:strand:- start:1958 stop:2656 length:699 start_codon:yes stop_codon:yes gene_type:complete